MHFIHFMYGLVLSHLRREAWAKIPGEKQLINHFFRSQYGINLFQEEFFFKNVNSRMEMQLVNDSCV